MHTIVRRLVPADTAGFARVGRAALPFMLETPGSVLFAHERAPRGASRPAGRRGGRCVHRHRPGRRGAPRNPAFATRRGHRPARSAHVLRLGPDAACVRDEPGDVETEFGDYAHRPTDTWAHPLLDRELTSVAVSRGRAVVFGVAYTDGYGRCPGAMTGALREFRGRGLALLTETGSLRRARAVGCTEACTGNAPMLAVNARFGYQTSATEVRHVRQLDAPARDLPRAG